MVLVPLGAIQLHLSLPVLGAGLSQGHWDSGRLWSQPCGPEALGPRTKVTRPLRVRSLWRPQPLEPV